MHVRHLREKLEAAPEQPAADHHRARRGLPAAARPERGCALGLRAPRRRWRCSPSARSRSRSRRSRCCRRSTAAAPRRASRRSSAVARSERGRFSRRCRAATCGPADPRLLRRRALARAARRRACVACSTPAARVLAATDPDAVDPSPDARARSARDRRRTAAGDGRRPGRGVPVRARRARRIVLALRKLARRRRRAPPQVVTPRVPPAALAGAAGRGAARARCSTGAAAARHGACADAALRVTERGPGAAAQPPTTAATRSATSRARSPRCRSGCARQEQARRAFVATASHELRTPLTSLQVMLELLDEDLDERRRRRRRARRRCAARAARRSGSRRWPPSCSTSAASTPASRCAREPVELGEVCRAVGRRVRAARGERDVELDAAADGPSGRAATRARSRGSLRILLDNALRVTPAGADVACRVARPNGDAPRSWSRTTARASRRGRRERDLRALRRGRQARAAASASGWRSAASCARRWTATSASTARAPGARFVIRLPFGVAAARLADRAEPRRRGRRARRRGSG